MFQVHRTCSYFLICQHPDIGWDKSSQNAQTEGNAHESDNPSNKRWLK